MSTPKMLVPDWQPFATIGVNYHGSYPLFLADTGTMKPNFRHFDWFLDCLPPSQEIGDRIWKAKDKESHASTVIQVCNGRSIPIVYLAAVMGGAVHYMHSLGNNKPRSFFRWNFVWFFGMHVVYNNGMKFVCREKAFLHDFQRNQEFGQEELRRQRDEQRVREAKYILRYKDDPYMEFRVKEYEMTERFK